MPAGASIEAVWRRTVGRAASAGDATALPLQLSVRVLDRYLAREGVKLLRTDTVGRLIQPGRPVIDFGIVAEEREIHIRFSDLLQLIPESERDHWLDHLSAPLVSRALLQMQLNPAACHDDGELREWRPEPTD